ncbi:MAG: hypothetical protein ABII00_15115 [Elusimicrobiota bacterium]
MRVAVDAAGAGSFRCIVEGALRAAREEGHEVLLFGPEEALRGELRLLGADGDGATDRGITRGSVTEPLCEEMPLPDAVGKRPASEALGAASGISVHDAPNVVSADEDPSAACREKPDASVMRAAESVADKRADALVSVAEPAVVVAASLWHMKRVRGVLKPALACPLPSRGGSSLLVDAGACIECKPWHLLQFALMGAVYAHRAGGIARPSVRMLVAGTVEGGGGELVREALPLLKYSGIDFRGTMRADEIPTGAADVIVTDGATGDIIVRLMRGLSDAYSEMLKSEIGSGLAARMGGTLARGALRRVETAQGAIGAGGEPLLGVGGPAVLCRDPGGHEAVASAIRTAARLAGSDVHERLQERLDDIKSSMEFARTIE